MSWRLGEPRFVVTSVSGYGGDGGNDSAYATTYQVLDSAYCYEPALETRRRGTAERIAREMNGGDLYAAQRRMRDRVRRAAKSELYNAARKKRS